ATKTIKFHLPATALRVRTLPAKGYFFQPLTTTVQFETENGIVTDPESTTRVTLHSDLEELDGQVLTFDPADPKKSRNSVELKLQRTGHWTVSAKAREGFASPLTSPLVAIELGFPWAPLLLAMVGGALGSVYRSGPRAARGWALTALPGLVFGLVTYALAAFVGAPQTLPVWLAALPATHWLGATVLGLGRRDYWRPLLPMGGAIA